MMSIARPLPEKKLNIAWKTFRNLLTPGQKEEWTLKITTPDGKPAKAQLMSVLYDKSLDQIAPHSWKCRSDSANGCQAATGRVICGIIRWIYWVFILLNILTRNNWM